MIKQFDLFNKLFLGAILLTTFVAEIGFARFRDSDESGYLSNRPYDLTSQKGPLNSSRIEIRDADATEKVFVLNFSFSSSGSSITDKNVTGTGSATWIGIEFDWNVTKWIKAQFIGGYQFAKGNSATVYGTESNPYTGPGFDEASFTTTVIPATQISAGLVKTELNPLSSSFSGSGFAGFREVVEFKSGDFVGSLKGFQVAPSSVSASNRALDDKKSPFLTIGNLNLGIKQKRLEVMFGFSKFDFYGLTTTLADEARYIGNTVIGDGSKTVYYKYKFRGQEIAAKTELTFRIDDKLGFSGNMTKNDVAPEKRNSGWKSSAYYVYNMGRYSVKPSITRFRFDPDLLPAQFSSGSFGYLNRDGYSGEIRATLKKYKLEGFLSYLDAKEVEPKAAQSDRISLTVGLEVKYEIL